MKIPYTLVSMAAILRDYYDPNYLNDEHYKLTSIADYLYNSADGAFSDHPEDNLLPEFKVLFDKYGKAYFDKVLNDMYALDGQLTSDDKIQELFDDYADRLDGVTASTKVTATEDNSYNQHLVQVSKEDKQYVLNDLNNSHKTVGMGGAGDPGYYVSEFEPAYGLYLWASDTGLRILDDNGIEYTEVKKSIGASTKVTASRHWREKTECKTKNGKITRMQNISSIFNDVDYYILYDANGKFVEKSIDFNYLHDKLYDVGKDDSQPSPAAKFLKGHPLSIADVEGLWDILPMYVDFGDSDALLQENGYTLDQASEFLRQGYSIYVDASTKVIAATNYDTKLIAKWLKAKFDDEAFGTAYTMHRISDADAYMSRNGLTYNRRNNTIDLWKSGGDEDIPVYKVIPQYSSTKRQGTYAPKMPKLVPIDEWNATHGVTASTRITATEDNVTTIYGDYDTILTIDMWYGDKFVPRKYGADASFYGNDGEYRGNIYNESGKIIGDYTSDNSVLIEENFLIDFGE